MSKSGNGKGPRRQRPSYRDLVRENKRLTGLVATLQAQRDGYAATLAMVLRAAHGGTYEFEASDLTDALDLLPRTRFAQEESMVVGHRVLRVHVAPEAAT